MTEVNGKRTVGNIRRALNIRYYFKMTHQVER